MAVGHNCYISWVTSSLSPPLGSTARQYNKPIMGHGRNQKPMRTKLPSRLPVTCRTPLSPLILTRLRPSPVTLTGHLRSRSLARPIFIFYPSRSGESKLITRSPDDTLALSNLIRDTLPFMKFKWISIHVSGCFAGKGIGVDRGIFRVVLRQARTSHYGWLLVKLEKSHHAPQGWQVFGNGGRGARLNYLWFQIFVCPKHFKIIFS